MTPGGGLNAVDDRTPTPGVIGFGTPVGGVVTYTQIRISSSILFPNNEQGFTQAVTAKYQAQKSYFFISTAAADELYPSAEPRLMDNTEVLGAQFVLGKVLQASIDTKQGMQARLSMSSGSAKVVLEPDGSWKVSAAGTTVAGKNTDLSSYAYGIGKKLKFVKLSADLGVNDQGLIVTNLRATIEFKAFGFIPFGSASVRLSTTRNPITLVKESSGFVGRAARAPELETQRMDQYVLCAVNSDAPGC